MKYEVNNCSISTIINDIKNKIIAIPEIQRPFVWDTTQVRDLIDSLYNGYPVGYIIVWQNPDVKLKDGTISFGRKVIIDGQQRITALTAAIASEKVTGSNYKKIQIKIAFNPIEEKFEVLNPAIEKNSIWISDISELFNAGFPVYKFITEYASKNNISDIDKLASIIQKVQGIQNNNLGVISLSKDLDIDAVTEIFIRINSKGEVLSQADFAMSKISSNEDFNGNNTRKIIDYFCHLKQNPEDLNSIIESDSEFSKTDEFNSLKWIKDESEDIYIPAYDDVLRVAFTSKFMRGKIADLVSLLSGRDFKTREFKIEIEEESFEKLRKGVLDFINKTNFQRFIMIIESLGIIKNSLIRSQNVLNFGYIIYLFLKNKNIDSAIIEKTVRRWIILSILTTRYSGSPESKFEFDIKHFAECENPLDFVDQIEKGELSEAYWNEVLPMKLNTAAANSPFFNVFLMAQIKAGDKGFLSEQIEIKSMITERGDVHHLFPKNFLIKNGVSNKNMYNQIANYTYLQQEINIKIKDASPKEYMAKILEQCESKNPIYGGIIDKEKLLKNLKENCIPENFLEMDINDYNSFLEKRRKLMSQKIKTFYESLK